MKTTTIGRLQLGYDWSSDLWSTTSIKGHENIDLIALSWVKSPNGREKLLRLTLGPLTLCAGLQHR